MTGPVINEERFAVLCSDKYSPLFSDGSYYSSETVQKATSENIELKNKNHP